MTQRTRSKGLRSGFTLVEVAIGAAILFVLAAGLVESVAGVKSLAVKGDIDARLQSAADLAMSKMRSSLRRSGFVSANGKLYPHTFTSGDAGPGFDLHDHAPADQHDPAPAVGNIPSASGPNREIVFVEPVFTRVQQGVDGTNYALDDASVTGAIRKIYDAPEIDGGGDATWSADETSFVVVTRPDGGNCLERRINAASPEVQCRFVERMTIETSNEDPVQIPIGAVRVRLWLQDKDDEGTLHRHFAEAVFHLRNG